MAKLKKRQRDGQARKQNKVILIVCEGTKTEKHYFESLVKAIGHRRRLKPARVFAYRESPRKLLERAKKQQAGYTEAWLVFDVERAGTHRDLQDVVSEARRYKIQLAISNPAFELWYLLHLVNTSKAFMDAAEIETELNKELNKQGLKLYQKSDRTMYERVAENMQTAIERAKALSQHEADNLQNALEALFPNPSTHVYRLVQRLIEITE